MKKEKHPKKEVKKEEKKKKEEEKLPPDPRKVILITGANRGLGLAFTESLIRRQPQLRILMTSRDQEKGEAAHNLLKEKYTPKEDEIINEENKENINEENKEENINEEEKKEENINEEKKEEEKKEENKEEDKKEEEKDEEKNEEEENNEEKKENENEEEKKEEKKEEEKKEEVKFTTDHLYYHQLDITNDDSINEIIEYIKKNFKKIDYLINNAGYSSFGTDFNENVCEETFKVNFYGTVNFTEKILSANIFNKNGKIIFVSSKSGTLNKFTNENTINKFKNAKASEDIVKLADKFKKSVSEGKVTEEGWYQNCFAVSKLFINFYAKMIVKKREVTKEALGIYSVHPGWIKTDMGGENAPLEVTEGVQRITYLLDLPEPGNKDLQGKLFDENKVFNFEGETKTEDKKKDKKKK